MMPDFDAQVVSLVDNTRKSAYGRGVNDAALIFLARMIYHVRKYKVCHVKEAHEVGVDNVLILLSLDVDPVAVICDACA